MAAPSLGTVLRTLFVLLGCGIAATVIYTIATDGLPFRKQLLTPWMAATLVDFYINILVIGLHIYVPRSHYQAWIIYKESNWIRAIIWIVFLVCLGSITTCGYIVLQFFKLTPQESLQDPIYFVLLRTRQKDGTESKGKLSVVGARVLFSVLGCLMLGTLIYTIAIDGSPFRQELYTPFGWHTKNQIGEVQQFGSFCLFALAVRRRAATLSYNYSTSPLKIPYFSLFSVAATGQKMAMKEVCKHSSSNYRILWYT